MCGGREVEGVVGGRWEVWCAKITAMNSGAPPELEVGPVPPGVWRATHRPQLILDLCPQGLHK